MTTLEPDATDDLVYSTATDGLTVSAPDDPTVSPLTAPEDLQVVTEETVVVSTPPESPPRRNAVPAAPVAAAALAAFAVAWRWSTQRRESFTPAPAPAPAPRPEPLPPAAPAMPLRPVARDPEVPETTSGPATTQRLPQVEQTPSASGNGARPTGGSTALVPEHGSRSAGTSTAGQRAGRFVRQHLRTGETKEFFKTSEFLLMLLGVLALVVAAAVQDTFDAREMWRLVALLLAAYVVSRGIAKLGSSRSEN